METSDQGDGVRQIRADPKLKQVDVTPGLQGIGGIVVAGGAP